MPKKVVRNLSDTELNGKKKKQLRGASGSDSELDKISRKINEDGKKRTSIIEKFKTNFGNGNMSNGDDIDTTQIQKDKSKQTKKENEKMSPEDGRCRIESSSDDNKLTSKTINFDKNLISIHGTNGFNNNNNNNNELRNDVKISDENHINNNNNSKGSEKYESGSGSGSGRVASSSSPRRGDSEDLMKKKNVVNTLLQSSHWGYGNSNVKSWNGTQSSLEREIMDEKCESTKRTYSDLYNEDFDRGKLKKLKTHDDRDRPRYNNLFQKKQQNYQEKMMNYYHWRGNNRNHRRYGNDFQNSFKRQHFKMPRSGRKSLGVTKYFPSLLGNKKSGPKKNHSSG
ncbi:conserved hypothetical protein [Pediculus humanus corporis]|uniref:Uncharacterized protein n=1 Tax=Pediculus humanus subsp. corporis TaxID=121224 RepID=E0VAQ2_PEDHC|nr:uncharacterized protein Phum_PHUM042210 [Pediculus humanus corporis]EEB10458.1 conserved hypothetical protein [Pediculus humanus corporis]